jgi:hypothetical protein
MTRSSDFHQTVYMLAAGIGPDDVRSALFFFSVFGPGLMIDVPCHRFWPVNLGKWILHNVFQSFIREREQAHVWRYGIPADDLPLSPDVAAASASLVPTITT